MRGEDQRAASFFSYVSLEQRIPADHPLRPIRELVDEALGSLSPAFSKLYARDGRPSIPPERLLRALRTSLAEVPLGPPGQSKAKADPVRAKSNDGRNAALRVIPNSRRSISPIEPRWCLIGAPIIHAGKGMSGRPNRLCSFCSSASPP
jgi:hypothetical protein